VIVTCSNKIRIGADYENVIKTLDHKLVLNALSAKVLSRWKERYLIEVTIPGESKSRTIRLIAMSKKLGNGISISCVDEVTGVLGIEISVIAQKLNNEVNIEVEGLFNTLVMKESPRLVKVFSELIIGKIIENVKNIVRS